MRDAYIYTTFDARNIRVQESINDDDAVHVSVSSGTGLHAGIDIPAAQRRHAAQALAGDEWRVVPAKQPGDPEPMDPADVKVGMVVEVEADDGSWLVRGEVTEVLDGGAYYDMNVSRDAKVISTRGATVRLVRPAEPEPDPEQVEALYRAYADAEEAVSDSGDGSYSGRELVRELVRRGVTVEGI